MFQIYPAAAAAFIVAIVVVSDVSLDAFVFLLLLFVLVQVVFGVQVLAVSETSAAGHGRGGGGGRGGRLHLTHDDERDARAEARVAQQSHALVQIHARDVGAVDGDEAIAALQAAVVYGGAARQHALDVDGREAVVVCVVVARGELEAETLGALDQLDAHSLAGATRAQAAQTGGRRQVLLLLLLLLVFVVRLLGGGGRLDGAPLTVDRRVLFVRLLAALFHFTDLVLVVVVVIVVMVALFDADVAPRVLELTRSVAFASRE